MILHQLTHEKRSPRVGAVQPEELSIPGPPEVGEAPETQHATSPAEVDDGARRVRNGA